LLKATGFLGESKAISAYFGGEGGSCAFFSERGGVLSLNWDVGVQTIRKHVPKRKLMIVTQKYHG